LIFQRMDLIDFEILAGSSEMSNEKYSEEYGYAIFESVWVPKK